MMGGAKMWAVYGSIIIIGVKMQTNRILNNYGVVYAFEIRNDFVSLRRIVEILKSVNGVSDIDKPKWKLLFNRTCVKLEFSFEGIRYVVSELHGDSDMYWIGPKDMKTQNEGILKIEGVFKATSALRIVDVIKKILRNL